LSQQPDPLANSLSTCPLCGSSGAFRRFGGLLKLGYRLCDTCQLIYMEREFLPSPAAEKAHYQTHQNGPQYPGYVAFLNQAVTPTLPYLTSGMIGLDFGCGPGPAISELLYAKGIFCDNYDPFFFPTLPEKAYDFVFLTEAAEHFFYPGQELGRIRDLLKPGGIFTLMTETWKEAEEFDHWYYANDFTHVCFYHARTIDFICAQFGFILLKRESPRVSILRKWKSS
jgi:SAM-dependent methyltransferase